MSVVSCGGVNAVLVLQARPGIGHQATQLVALFLVACIVDVRRSLVNQEARELQQ